MNYEEEYVNEIIHFPSATTLEEFEIKVEEAIAKKSTYTDAHRKAQQRYREKYPEKYCELQRKLYERKKVDEEWKKKFNERSKIHNKKYRDKKNLAIIEAGGEIKPRGRPRKNLQDIL
jgi:dolichyl-phosphate-mannose--protein O-mannosyl transferase